MQAFVRKRGAERSSIRSEHLVRDLRVEALLVEQIRHHISDHAIDLFLVVDEMRGLVGQGGDELAERAVLRLGAGFEWILHEKSPGFSATVTGGPRRSQSGKTRSFHREIP